MKRRPVGAIYAGIMLLNRSVGNIFSLNINKNYVNTVKKYLLKTYCWKPLDAVPCDVPYLCVFKKIKIYWHVALFKLFLLHVLEIRLLKH